MLWWKDLSGEGGKSGQSVKSGEFGQDGMSGKSGDDGDMYALKNEGKHHNIPRSLVSTSFREEVKHELSRGTEGKIKVTKHGNVRDVRPTLS